MNIYDYYNKPQELKWYKEAHELVPDLFWNGLWAEYTPEQIKAISTHPRYAYAYARDVIKDRWPEAEPYIMKQPWYAYDYANKVLKDRWPEAEPYIIKTPALAYLYARHLMKDRWPEAEPYIKQDEYWWDEYTKTILI